LRFNWYTNIHFLQKRSVCLYNKNRDFGAFRSIELTVAWFVLQNVWHHTERRQSGVLQSGVLQCYQEASGLWEFRKLLTCEANVEGNAANWRQM
jgi:tryptophan 2,3-dioxygenase